MLDTRVAAALDLAGQQKFLELQELRIRREPLFVEVHDVDVRGHGIVDVVGGHGNAGTS